MQHYCHVLRVIDGDTFEASVNLGFEVSIVITVRLWGCNCPEIKDRTCETGKRAKEFVKAKIEGKEVLIWAYEKDSFGRWICDVIVDTKYLTDMLLNEKLAVPYFPESKDKKYRDQKEQMKGSGEKAVGATI